MAPEKNLIVIPGSFYNPTTQRTEFNGVFVYYVDNTQLFIRGVVNHISGPLDTLNRNVERSLYIEEYLYSKSPCQIKINEL